MIKIFEKFTQWDEVETYINICKKILVDFDLNRPGKFNEKGVKLGGIDTYGRFKVMYDKYYEIKKILLEKFPNFKIKNSVSRVGANQQYPEGQIYPVNHINWYESTKLKKSNFIILLEINHSTQDNPDYGGRLRFWAGIPDKDGYGRTDVHIYRNKPIIKSSESDPWGEEDWSDEQ